MLALVAIGQLTKIEWNAFEGHKWVPYNHRKGMTKMLPGKLPLIRGSTNGTKVREDGHPEAKPV